MTKTEIVTLIHKLGLRPGKSLGQNFMVDANMLDFIVRSAAPTPKDNVLEIGPGFGALTERLISHVSALHAVEMDIKLFSYLQSKFKYPNFHLINADAMKLDYRELMRTSAPALADEFRIISNLPYSISTPFILKMIESGNIPRSMHFVLQDETADRFAAKPSDADYGASSVITQCFFEVEKIRKIPNDVFYPRPEVESAFVAFKSKGFNLSDENKKNLFRSIKTAFSRRRKTLANNLSTICEKDRTHEILRAMSLSEKARAEELSPELHIRLAKSIFK